MILASLFQDGAILQRDMDIPVWGKTDPETLVKVTLDGETSMTRSSADGKFIAYLHSHAAGGPYELTVSAPETGKSITLKDILVGEVWLASGQSNMEYMLGSDWRIADENGDLPEGEVLGRIQEQQFNDMVIDPDNFRFFTVEKKASCAMEDHCKGSWQKMNRLNSPEASAVAAWFGLGLQMHLNIPVGLIISAWGGTIAEAWMSYEALANCPETAMLAKMVRRNHWINNIWEVGPGAASGAIYEKNPAVKPDPGNTGADMGYAETDFDDSDWQTIKIPGSWIRQHLAGNGVVWCRKHVDIPSDWSGKKLSLAGGTVDKHDITYFNGQEIGRTGSDFDITVYNKKRIYSIDPSLVSAGKAVIAIRAYSFAHDGAINGKWRLINTETEEFIELNGVWQFKTEYDWGIAEVNFAETIFGPNNPNTPSILFDGMIRPLLPYALRGTIWYQGESNAKTLKKSREYRDVLQCMIDDWRWHFRNPQMPFIMVQLAGYGNKENFFADSLWGELRESQRLICQNDPDTFMASAIDIGEETDIHPQNKLDVGKRLAMCALHHVYGCTEAIPGGPEVEKAEFAGNTVKISFKYADGLKLASDEKAFYLAGTDGQWAAADQIEIKDECVTLTSEKIAGITSVKYAWADFPTPVLFNGAGMPASSFHIEQD